MLVMLPSTRNKSLDSFWKPKSGSKTTGASTWTMTCCMWPDSLPMIKKGEWRNCLLKLVNDYVVILISMLNFVISFEGGMASDFDLGFGTKSKIRFKTKSKRKLICNHRLIQIQTNPDTPLCPPTLLPNIIFQIHNQKNKIKSSKPPPILPTSHSNLTFSLTSSLSYLSPTFSTVLPENSNLFWGLAPYAQIYIFFNQTPFFSHFFISLPHIYINRITL